MDFDLTPEQQDAAALARKILSDRCTPQRQREVEATGVRFDRDLWAALGEAGLLGLALSEDDGGAGLSLLELYAVTVESGRAVAPLPLAWHGPTADALAHFGTEAQRREWLPGAAGGATVAVVWQDQRSGGKGALGWGVASARTRL